MEENESTSTAEPVSPEEFKQTNESDIKMSASPAIKSLKAQAKRAQELYQKNFISLTIVAIFSVLALLAVVIGVEEAVRIQLVSLKSKEAEAEIENLKIIAQEAASKLALTKSQISTLSDEEKNHRKLLRKKERGNTSLKRELSRLENNSDLPDLFFGIGVSNGQIRFIPGEGGTILQYKSGQWSKHPQSNSLTEGSLYNLWLNASGTEGWAVGEEGTILQYKSGQWSRHLKSKFITEEDLVGLWLNASGTEGWAVGEEGTILQYKSGQWSRNPQSNSLTKANLYNLWLNASGTEGWAVGEEGTILQYKSGQWSKHPQSNSLTEVVLYNLWLKPSGKEGWAVGEEGTILQYKSGQWSRHLKSNSLTEENLADLWLNASGTEGLAVGAGGTMLQYKNGQWSRHLKSNSLTEDDLIGLWLNASGTEGWAAGMNGTILEYSDPGSWKLAKLKIFSEKEEEDRKLRMEDLKKDISFSETDLGTYKAKADDYAQNIGKLKESLGNLEAESTNSSALVLAMQKTASKIKQPASDNVQQSITRGGAIAGAIGIAIFLMQIFLSSMRYYAKLSELYTSQATALLAANGNSSLFLELVNKLSPQVVDFGPAPTHLYSKILDAMKDISKNVKLK